MNICILGWYGTETLGDRAIIEGIIKIFDSIEKNDISIGSLYPFFTERTLIEEQEALNIMGITSNIYCFDVLNSKTLKKQIETSDLVIMGGGPLMDLSELDIIDKSFQYAKKRKIHTGIIGCGIGPLNKPEFRRSVYNILINSDISIFRDTNSLSEAQILNNQFGNRIDETTLYASNDPAIIPIGFFKCENNVKDRLVVNFRDLGFQTDNSLLTIVDNKLISLLKNMSNQFKEIVLLPNHIFSIGGDDRFYFSKLKQELMDYENIVVIHKPLSLFQTFEIIKNSKAAIGMRYHSIVFQSYLNGNNYILDYTEKKKGKIISFLNDNDPNEFFADRYYSLIDLNKGIEFKITKDIFEYDNKIFEKTIEFYVSIIKRNIY